jgi:arginyl-tRNA synthetase
VEPVIGILEQRISSAMAAVTGCKDCSAIVTPATNPEFGDYQANGAMSLAKKLKTNPRQLAEKIVEKLQISDICEQPEIAGAGFINLRLTPGFLEQTLLKIKDDPANLALEKTSAPQIIVVDFSGPNIAKQMHVGHLRSTIIGDCICRLLEFVGNKVIRQNHVGDWGTQFGMLCALIEHNALEAGYKGGTSEVPVKIEDLEAFYKEAKKRFDKDINFANRARTAISELHSGDKFWHRRWQRIVEESRRHYQPIYDTLGVNLHKENECGESFYADKLADVISDLRKQKLAEESDGAICVFPEDFKNKQGQRLPLIIQKSDGAYLYATTDLAAIRYRVNKLKADRIIYVTDTRQNLHFQMVFAVARMAGWVSENVQLSHVTFGSVLGENGKPLKTRTGENVRLKELLDEAVERAKAVVDEKNPDLSEDKKTLISRAVGIGAVKYADYSNNRTSDYIFSFDKMLAMDGNTAPYMQYAYARIKSIERKAQSRDVDIDIELSGINSLDLTEQTELGLAGHLIRYSEAIKNTVSDFRPNYLTSYLYELAQKFSAFYTDCPVLQADSQKRPTRILLCDLTAKTIKHGLSQLLGIEVVEQM